jgi:hypothetical protein
MNALFRKWERNVSGQGPRRLKYMIIEWIHIYYKIIALKGRIL